MIKPPIGALLSPMEMVMQLSVSLCYSEKSPCVHNSYLGRGVNDKKMT